VRHQDNHGDWSAYSEERSFTTRNTPAGSSVVLALLSDMLEITFDTVSGDGHTTATTLEQASPGSGPIPPEFRAIGGTFVEMSTTADHTGPVVLRLGYAQFQSDVTKESGLKVFHWNGTAWQDVTTSLDTLNDVVSAEVPALSTVFIGNPWREAETPAGTDVTITPGDLIMTFHSVTTSGTTTVSTSGVNPASPIDDSLSCVGRVFVDISTAATYSGPVTVGVRYTELDVVRDESDLRLYHWNGTEWEDITTRVDTDNNVVYGEVANLSSFFIGEVVTGDSPMSVSILIGIAIVLAVGAVVYFASRRFVGKRA
jgi:hypothetical protein